MHADEVTVSRGQNAEGTNGEILNADGSQFETRRIPYGEPFTFKVQPANGFKFSHVVIRMGYNLDGDSLVHDTPQYEDIVVPAYAFKDNTCTIPIVQGDVRITPYFPQDNGTTEVGGEDYHISMPEGAVAQQRQLKSITFTSSSDGTQTLALPEEAQDYAVRTSPWQKGPIRNTTGSCSSWHISRKARRFRCPLQLKMPSCSST